MNKNSDFIECVPMTDMQQDERYDLELIVRFLLYMKFTDDFLNTIDKSRSSDAFLTEELEKMATEEKYLIDESMDKFNRIFSVLNRLLGENTFKKYQNGTFKGAILLASFESIIPGLFLNLEY